MILQIYSNPSAKVLINGGTTTEFKIMRGTRQGCPLSPLLFNLYIEQLPWKLRGEKKITPFKLDTWGKNNSLYADNLMICTADLQSSLSEVEQLVLDFSKGIGIRSKLLKHKDNGLEYRGGLSRR